MMFRLKPRADKSLPFVMFASFLMTFVVSRWLVLSTSGFYLSSYIKDGAIHVHHFAYGIVLMSIIGTMAILTNLSNMSRYLMAILFGIGMGMAYDEFAMWIQLENNYYDRMTYDAVFMISLIFINIIYFGDFWKKFGKYVIVRAKIMGGRFVRSS